jgi:hypothetical protein
MCTHAIDGVFAGMLPRDKDQVKENAEIAPGILSGCGPAPSTS